MDSKYSPNSNGSSLGGKLQMLIQKLLNMPLKNTSTKASLNNPSIDSSNYHTVATVAYATSFIANHAAIV